MPGLKGIGEKELAINYNQVKSVDEYMQYS